MKRLIAIIACILPLAIFAADVKDSVIIKNMAFLKAMEEEDTARYAGVAHETIKRAEKLHKDSVVANCYNFLITYYLVGPSDNLSQAAVELENFRPFVEKTVKFVDWYYILWQNIILMNYEANNIIHASMEVNRMLEYAKKYRHEYGLACTHTLLGFFNEEYDFETAIENYELALKYAEQSKHKEKCSYIYQSMAHTAYYAKKYEEVFTYIDKALEYKPAPKQHQSSDCLRLKSYIKMEKPAEARKCYERLKHQWDRKEISPSYMRTVAQALCVYLCKYGNPEESRKYWEYVDDPLEVKVLYYKTIKDFQTAFELKEKVDSTLQAANTERQQADIANANAFYRKRHLEYEKRLLEDKYQQLELENAKNEGQRKLLIIFALILMLAAASAIIVISRIHNVRLRAERAKAVHLNEMKTTFINSMSHEVRTPINAINGFNDLLHSGMEFSDEDRMAMLSSISEQTDALVLLLEKVIYLSRIDGDDLKANIHTVDLCETIHKASDLVTEKLAPGVTFALPQDAPAVKADHEMLITVLKEVLDNAAKFTDEGEITVTAESIASSKVQISIANQGPAIPHEAAEQIFERFEKLGSFKPGFGLGLSIARALLTQMNGTIALDTRSTRATRFIITLDA